MVLRFLYLIGVSEEMQKVGSSVIPEVAIETADGNHFKITTVTTFTTVSIEFNLGEEFELTTADGRKTKVFFLTIVSIVYFFLLNYGCRYFYTTDM